MMKALLLKDIFTLTKQLKVFFVLIIVFALVPKYSMAGFAMLYSAMLPITALAYDERSKWNKLAAMMPYSIRDIILSKYILGYICIGMATILSVVGKIIEAYFSRSQIGSDIFVELLSIFCMATMLQAFNLPCMFKMGVEKGRLVFLLTTAIVVFIGKAFPEKIANIIDTTTIDIKTFGIIMIIATIFINLISILISEYFYKKRDL